jgi:ABC-type multidrug transport system ATPase subunit
VDYIYVLAQGRVAVEGKFEEIERTGFNFNELKQNEAKDSAEKEGDSSDDDDDDEADNLKDPVGEEEAKQDVAMGSEIPPANVPLKRQGSSKSGSKARSNSASADVDPKAADQLKAKEEAERIAAGKKLIQDEERGSGSSPFSFFLNNQD